MTQKWKLKRGCRPIAEISRGPNEATEVWKPGAREQIGVDDYLAIIGTVIWLSKNRFAKVLIFETPAGNTFKFVRA
jgi:hypothetical protein